MLYCFLQKPVQNRKVVTSHVVTSDCSAEVASTPKSVSALADLLNSDESQVQTYHVSSNDQSV